MQGRRAVAIRRLGFASVVAVATIAIAIGSSARSNAAATSSPTLLAGYGMWNLSKLGVAGSITVPVTPDPGGYSQVTVQFRLPAGAAQNRQGRWYLVHNNFRISFNREFPTGFADVSAKTNGRTASLVEFSPQLVTGQFVVPWITTDWIMGGRARTATSDLVHVRSVNFLQETGIHGDLNALTFQLEQHAGAKVTALEILPQSGIEISRWGPAAVNGRFLRLSKPPHRGTAFRLRYVVKPHSPRAAFNVQLKLDVPQEVRVIGSQLRQINELPSKTKGSFSLVGARPGWYELRLTARIPSLSDFATLAAVRVHVRR